MGCGASTNNPATDEHMKEMCDVAAKDMEILCVTYAMSGISSGNLKVEVRTPECVDSWKETVASLRAKAKELKDDGAAGTGNKGAGAAAALASGGAIGGMLASAAKVVDGAADTVANLAGNAAGAGVNGVADTLEKAIQTLEGPFQEVGKQVVSESYKDFLSSFSDFITNYKFSNALVLIRGEKPHGADQYAQVDKKGIANALSKSASNDIVAKVLGTTRDAIARSTAVSMWTKMIETNKSVCKSINGLAEQHSSLSGLNSLTDKLKAETNMEEHITSEIVLSICNHMGTREEELRNDSSQATTHSKKDATFRVVFSGNQLMESHYSLFKN